MQFLSTCFPWLNDQCERSVFHAIAWLEQPCTWCFVIHIKAVLIQVSKCYIIMFFGLSAWFHQVCDSLTIETFGTKWSRMDQVKFFKGCLSQILLGPFLNTMFHVLIISTLNSTEMLLVVQYQLSTFKFLFHFLYIHKKKGKICVAFV